MRKPAPKARKRPTASKTLEATRAERAKLDEVATAMAGASARPPEPRYVGPAEAREQLQRSMTRAQQHAADQNTYSQNLQKIVSALLQLEQTGEAFTLTIPNLSVDVRSERW